MLNKMNRSMVPEKPIEKEIEKLLIEARNSKELVDFAENIKEDLKSLNISFYSHRIKKIYSAIRTFRIAKYQRLEELQDLFGILVVVRKERDIKKVVKKIKKRLKEEYVEYNLLKEKEWIEQDNTIKNVKREYVDGQKQIVSELKRVFSNTENLEKVFPPFSYIITTYVKMEDKKIPVEIRIQSKTGFQIVESAYFTIYKNDEINPEIKAPLLFVLHQLISRKIKLDKEKDFGIGEKQRLINEMGELYQFNFNLLCENREVVLDVWREYVKISVKYRLKLPVYDFHFFGYQGKNEEEMKKIEEILNQIFEEYKSYDLREIDVNEYINTAVNDIQDKKLV